MKLSELEDRLLEAGCSPSIFNIGSRTGSDVFVIERQRNLFKVYYSERGYDSKAMYTSTDEEEACQWFYDYICSKDNWHFVCSFREEAHCLEVARILSEVGVTPIRNDIPKGKVVGYDDNGHPKYEIIGTEEYRIFVAKEDIFPAKECFPELPIKNIEQVRAVNGLHASRSSRH